jgi:dienelactone hydrolase
VWERKRREIAEILTEFLGEPPTVKPPLNPRVVEERRFVDFVRRKVIFTSEPGDEIPAYLFIPTRASGKMAALLTPHQTNYDGKLEPAGIRGEPSLALAMQLAQRGYVTLAADAIAFGERHAPSTGHYGDAIEFYYRHPQWSILGKMNWDKGRAVDYLQSLDFVDPQRIGAIGHSHGAYGSLWAAAFDRRIKVVVASGGFDTFRSDGNTWRWSHATALLPKLGFYLGDQADNITLENFQDYRVDEVAEVPFDYHHLLSLLAPRPVFYAVALQDEVFPHADSVLEALQQVGKVYRLYGAKDRLTVYTFDGGHSFPAAARQKAFDWLDRWL